MRLIMTFVVTPMVLELETFDCNRNPYDCHHRPMYEIVNDVPNIMISLHDGDFSTLTCLRCEVAWKDGAECWVCGARGFAWGEPVDADEPRDLRSLVRGPVHRVWQLRRRTTDGFTTSIS